MTNEEHKGNIIYEKEIWFMQSDHDFIAGIIYSYVYHNLYNIHIAYMHMYTYNNNDITLDKPIYQPLISARSHSLPYYMHI